ncbi:MAG TPA: heavy metal-binding domain-containing protein [Alloprevotella sp.]|nr:heavy metal-binding domain-containing protein [Alloprevotella sp.]
MILSTTPTLEGHPIQQYMGIVTAQTIIGANAIRDFMAGLRDFFGGRSGSYEEVLRKAKATALEELSGQAAERGANAVVGIKLDYETVGANGSMLMVVASGTAVIV